MSAEMHSVLCMVFNHGKDELITGGTGGMKVKTTSILYNTKVNFTLYLILSQTFMLALNPHVACECRHISDCCFSP